MTLSHYSRFDAHSLIIDVEHLSPTRLFSQRHIGVERRDTALVPRRYSVDGDPADALEPLPPVSLGDYGAASP
jgi:hypothetical protein